MRKHNIERDGYGERGKENWCRENDIFKKGMKHIKARKRKTNTSSNTMRTKGFIVKQ